MNSYWEEKLHQAPFTRNYYIRSEVFNAISHGIGVILSIIATVLLIIKGIDNESGLEVFAYTVYGVSMTLLYLASTLYHSLSFTSAAPIFKIIDHSSIFLLIAGTYTPFCLIALNNRLGWLIFIAQWSIALVGIAMKIFFIQKMKRFSTLLYLIMGWLVVFAIGQVAAAIGFNGMLYLVLGGLTYSLGTFFYSKSHFRYFHVIWHFFVLAGSIFMFMAIYFFI
ncbi:PAQR family membrane homeostasis protein TrhA [Aerococcus kribbianus]|uniref:Hemolysin III family protein n=1 Tax=Aerococcus kribbianus TaxID=2999064 RepID=A0A9X3FLH9_9LACT|nr:MULTISPECIES: hemolysin III family protein [unclassified Aerococcus]MCZ0716712.1 hemolysin III family protein [Aerococcus sp. YH-aer221]MCZ0725000.1 hemolysin III family protein [Aerococcus sp. YH-aer222]